MIKKIPTKIRAYAAGFIDGEGCIGIYKSMRKKSVNYHYTLNVEISNTDIEPLNFIQHYYGGRLRPRLRKNKKLKTCFSLDFGYSESYKMLVDIKKYLIVKKERAEIAIRFIEIKNKFKKRPGRTREKFFIDMQEICRKEMNRLNRRGSKNEIKSDPEYRLLIQKLEEEDRKQLKLAYKTEAA